MYPWYSFLLQAESIPGHIAAGRIKSRTFRLVAQCHNRLRHRVPTIPSNTAPSRQTLWRRSSCDRWRQRGETPWHCVHVTPTFSVRTSWKQIGKLGPRRGKPVGTDIVFVDRDVVHLHSTDWRPTRCPKMCFFTAIKSSKLHTHTHTHKVCHSPVLREVRAETNNAMDRVLCEVRSESEETVELLAHNATWDKQMAALRYMELLCEYYSSPSHVALSLSLSLSLPHTHTHISSVSN